jgi:hypothetical protein
VLYKPGAASSRLPMAQLVSPKCFLTRSNCTVRVPRPEMVGAASCEVGHVTQRKVMPKPSLSRPPPKPQPSATAGKKSSTAADGFREDRVHYLQLIWTEHTRRGRQLSDSDHRRISASRTPFEP